MQVLGGGIEASLDAQARTVPRCRSKPGAQLIVGDDLVGTALDLGEDFFKTLGHG